MVSHHRFFALCLAGFCALGATAQAQVTAYSTGFDGTDVVNGTAMAATYASPDFSTTYMSNTDPTATGPTAPLASQNGWTSTDTTGPIGHGTFSTGNANQINGGTNYVGGLAGANGTNYFGGTQSASIGGIYSASAQTPYAVPSTASGGAVMLLHAVTVPVQTTSLVLNTDFAVLSGAGGSTNVNGTDTFAFVLANSAGTPVISVNFVPTSTPSNQDNLSATTGTAAVNSGFGVDLNSPYHLKVTLTPGVTSTYTVVISGSSGLSQNFSGTFSTALATITQVGASWNLTNKTIVNGGYTGAGDNILGFDNLSVSVPEPSTDALLALGLVGFAGLWRRRRPA